LRRSITPPFNGGILIPQIPLCHPAVPPIARVVKVDTPALARALGRVLPCRRGPPRPLWEGSCQKRRRPKEEAGGVLSV